MHDLTQTIRAAALPLIGLAVAAAAAVIALARRRVKAGDEPRAAFGRSALDVGAVGVVLAILVITFAPTGQYQSRQLQLLPLRDFFSDGSSGGFLDAASQAAGNLLLFVPFGLLVPLRRPRLDGWRQVLWAGAAFSAAIEILQVIVGFGHTTSVDDVIWNTLGGLLGYGLLRAVRRIRGRRIARSAGRARGPGGGDGALR